MLPTSLADVVRSLSRLLRKPAGRKSRRRARALAVEALEDRALLNAAPVFVNDDIIGRSNLNPDAPYILSADSALSLGINGFDEDGDPLQISATVKTVSPGLKLKLFKHTGNRFATMNYVRASDGAVIGSIVVELFETRGALAAERFILLSTKHVEPGANPGDPPVISDPTAEDPAFYTNVLVHRIADLTGKPGGTIFQSGDATNGNGTGGSPLPDYKDEFDPFLGFNGAGVLAAANANNPALGTFNTNDSQWFITTGPTQHLFQRHEIFGQVVAGLDVMQQIIALGSAGTRLASVDIGASPQDGTISVRSLNGKGGTATLTITLDDGQGNVTTKDVDITVVGSLDSPARRLGKGTTLSFTPQFAGAGPSPNVVASIATPVPGASAAFNNGQVHVTVPASFRGAVDVNVVVTNNDNGYTATRQFHIARENFNDARVIGGASLNFSTAPNPALRTKGLASAYVGDRLYIAAGEGGLMVYDMADPTDPLFLGRLDTPGVAQDVKVVGNTVFLADGANGLLSINAEEPESMVVLDRLEMPPEAPEGTSGATPGRAAALFVEGNTLYVAAGHGGFNVVDISDDEDLEVTQHVKFLEPPVGPGQVRDRLHNAVDIVKIGDRICVSDPLRGLFVFDSTKLGEPNSGFKGRIAGTFRGLDAAGSRVYAVDVTANKSALKIFEFQNPPGNQPPMKLLGSVRLNGAVQVAVAPLAPDAPENAETNLAIVGVQTGYAMVDVTKPGAPVLAGLVGAGTQPNTTSGGGGGIAAFGPKNLLALPLAASSAQIVVPTLNGTHTFTDENDRTVKLTMTGGRFRVVQDLATDDISFIDVVASDGNASLTIETPDGPTTIDGLRVGDPTDTTTRLSIGSLVASTLKVQGDVFVGGAVGTLNLGEVSGGDISIGTAAAGDTTAPTAAAVTLGTVAEVDLTSAMPLASLSVGSWADADADPDVVTAPGITGALTATASFGADLTLTGMSTGKTLGSADIAGELSGFWQVAGKTGALDFDSVGPGWTGFFQGVVEGLATRNDGNFAGTLDAPALTNFHVKGDMVGGSVSLTRPVNPNRPNRLNAATVTIEGSMTDSSIESQGHLGTIEVAAMVRSQILVGITPAFVGLPDSDDFTTPLARINSITVVGLGGADAFDGSVIAAGKLKNVTVADVAPDNANDDAPFGVVARTIGKYVRKEDGAVVTEAQDVTPRRNGQPRVIELGANDPTLDDDFEAKVLPPA